MKFFFQCLLFYLASSIVLILADQFIFFPDHVVSASILYGLVLGLIATLIFGWYLEVHINHSHDFTE